MRAVIYFTIIGLLVGITLSHPHQTPPKRVEDFVETDLEVESLKDSELGSNGVPEVEGSAGTCQSFQCSTFCLNSGYKGGYCIGSTCNCF